MKMESSNTNVVIVIIQLVTSQISGMKWGQGHGGRGHWAVDYTSPQSIISFLTLGIFIEL